MRTEKNSSLLGIRSFRVLGLLCFLSSPAYAFFPSCLPEEKRDVQISEPSFLSVKNGIPTQRTSEKGTYWDFPIWVSGAEAFDSELFNTYHSGKYCKDLVRCSRILVAICSPGGRRLFAYSNITTQGQLRRLTFSVKQGVPIPESFWVEIFDQVEEILYKTKPANVQGKEEALSKVEAGPHNYPMQTDRPKAGS